MLNLIINIPNTCAKNVVSKCIGSSKNCQSTYTAEHVINSLIASLWKTIMDLHQILTIKSHVNEHLKTPNYLFNLSIFPHHPQYLLLRPLILKRSF